MVKNIDNKADNIERNDLDSIKSQLNDLKKNIESSNEDLSSFSKELNLLKKSVEQNKKELETSDTIKEIHSELDLLWKEITDKINQSKKDPENIETHEAEHNHNKSGKNEKNGFRIPNTLNWRPLEIAENIGEISNDIENEYKNWRQEKNPIARWLLRLVDRIMNSEKN